MSIKATKKVSKFPGVWIKSDSKFRDAVAFFDKVNTAPTAASGLYGLYVDTSGNLVFTSNGSDTVVGAAGAGGSATWESIKSGDATFNLTSTWTLTQSADAPIFTLSKSGTGSGAVIDITNSGTGADIIGTGDTWQVSKAGSLTCTAIVMDDDETITLGASSDAVIQWVGASDHIDIEGATNFDGNMTIEAAHTLTIAGNAGSTVATVTAGDTVISDGSVSITDADNAETVTVINNTATTIGNASSAAVVQFESTSLTTGCLLGLQLTEGTLNGGSYLRAWDATGAGAVFTVAENGVTTIAGGGGANALTITAGDAVMSDGSLTITDADDAASLSVTNNTATTSSVIVLAGSGTFTGSTTSAFATLTPSGLTTGTALYLPAAAMTTGKGIDVVANSLTTGEVVAVTSSATAITGAGRLLNIDHTGATTTSGVIAEVSSAGTDETTIFRVTASAALASGVGISVSAASMTTGTALDIGDLDALTTGKGIDVVSNSSDASARDLIHVKNDHASATAAIPLHIENDGVVDSNFKIMIELDGTTVYIGDGSTSPEGNLTGVQGDICFAGDSGVAYFCDSNGTNWTAM